MGCLNTSSIPCGPATAAADARWSQGGRLLEIVRGGVCGKALKNNI